MTSMVIPNEEETVFSALKAAVESGHPEIVVLKKFIPWKKEIHEAEKEINNVLNIHVNVKYIIFLGWGGWRIQAIPLHSAFNEKNQQTPYQMSLEVRRPFPPSWWGLSDETLFAICKVDGATFIQNSGFIGGNKTMEGALKMAQASLKSDEISFKPSTSDTRKCRIKILKVAIKEELENNNDKKALRAIAQYNQAIGNEMLGIGNVNQSIYHFKRAFDYYLGDFQEKYASYEKEHFDHLDTCAVFYAECLEHSCSHVFEAIDILLNKIFFNEHIDESKFLNSDDTIYQYFPISSLLLLKLLYVAPVYDKNINNTSIHSMNINHGVCCGGPQSITLILKLLKEIKGFPNELKVEVKRRFKSHWAFFLFIQALVDNETNDCNINDDNTRKKNNNGKSKEANRLSVFHIEKERVVTRTTSNQDIEKLSLITNPILRWKHFYNFRSIPYPPLFVLGDSHTLTYAWRTLHLQSGLRTCVPILITGIKAWHFRKDTEFYTHTALHNALEEIRKNNSAKELIVSAGEIDVREGIGRALDKGRYDTLNAAIDATVCAYISELVDISKKYSIRLYVLPVPPHAKRPSKRGRWRNRERRRKSCTLFNECLRIHCKSHYGALHYLDFIDDLYIIDGGDTTNCENNTRHVKNHGKFSRGNDDAELQLDTEKRVLNPIYDSDKTHLNRNTLSLLQLSLDSMGECFKDGRGD